MQDPLLFFFHNQTMAVSVQEVQGTYDLLELIEASLKKLKELWKTS